MLSKSLVKFFCIYSGGNKVFFILIFLYKLSKGRFFSLFNSEFFVLFEVESDVFTKKGL
jgi:hypothetical protein